MEAAQESNTLEAVHADMDALAKILQVTNKICRFRCDQVAVPLQIALAGGGAEKCQARAEEHCIEFEGSLRATNNK